MMTRFSIKPIKKYIWVCGIAALFVINSCASRKYYHQIRYNEYAEMLKVKGTHAPIVDVRTKGEYDKGHIEGAQNISYFNSGFRKKVMAMEPSDTVFIYCETMHRSPLAAKSFKKAGFGTVIDLDKGFRIWRKNEMEMVKSGNR